MTPSVYDACDPASMPRRSAERAMKSEGVPTRDTTVDELPGTASSSKVASAQLEVLNAI